MYYSNLDGQRIVQFRNLAEIWIKNISVTSVNECLNEQQISDRILTPISVRSHVRVAHCT